MATFPEANDRLYKNIFVCKKCKTKQRAPTIKIIKGVINCRKCKSTHLRPVRKK